MTEKISGIIVKGRYFIIAAALVLSGLSVYWFLNVDVNYDMTKYLRGDTDTVRALEIMDEEFGLSGTSSVMIRNVTLAEAKKIRAQISETEGIKVVNFFGTPQYFLDEDGDGTGDALFKLFFDGGDYSDSAENVLRGLSGALDGYEIAFDGAAYSNMSLKDRIEGQIPLMTAIAVCIVVIILLLTSSSWLEPLVIGAALGFSVLLNMGTNYFLGEISFVTKSVSAVLQLALAIDYSIILLHQYNEETARGYAPEEAVKKALSRSLSPISSSALTTIAGLSATMFMSFRLGFDIGLILSKAILCSALSVFLFMPGLLAAFAKPMKKLAHKPLFKDPDKSKTGYANMLYKLRKPIAAVFLALFIGSYFIQSGTNFIYVESEKSMVGRQNAVEERFGAGNLVMLVMPAALSDADYGKQNELIDYLKALTKADGTPVYRDALSTVTVALRPVDADDAASLLGIDAALAAQLFGMYYIEKGTADGGAFEMSLKEFAVFADDLANGRKSLPGGIDVASVLGEKAGAVSVLRGLFELAEKGADAEGLYALLQSGGLKDLGVDLSGISAEYVTHLFGMYYLSEGYIADGGVSLKDIIAFLDGKIKSGADGGGIDLAAALSEDEIGMINAFAFLLDLLDGGALSPAEFYGALNDERLAALGFSAGEISRAYIGHIYAYYNFLKNGGNELSMRELAGFLSELLENGADGFVDISAFIGGGTAEYIRLLNGVLQTIGKRFAAEELFEKISGLGADILSEAGFFADAAYLKQLFGMYYYADGRMDGYDELTAAELIGFLAVAANSETEDAGINLSGLIDGETRDALDGLAKLLEILGGEFTYYGLYGELNGLTGRTGINAAELSQTQLEILYAWKQYKREGMALKKLTMIEVADSLSELAAAVYTGSELAAAQSALSLAKAFMQTVYPYLGGSPNTPMTLSEMNGAFFSNAALSGIIGGFITPETLELAYAYETFGDPVYGRRGVLENPAEALSFMLGGMVNPDSDAYLEIAANALSGDAASLIETLLYVDGDSKIGRDYAETTRALNGYAQSLGVETEDAIDAGLIKQAFILFFAENGFDNFPSDKTAETAALAEFAAALINPESEAYDALIYGFLSDALNGNAGESAEERIASFAAALGIIADLEENSETPLTFSEMTDALNGYIGVLNGEKIGSETIEQAYVMRCFAAQREKAETPAAFTEITDFVKVLIGDGEGANALIKKALDGAEGLDSALTLLESVRNDMCLPTDYAGAARLIEGYLRELRNGNAGSIVYPAAASDGAGNSGFAECGGNAGGAAYSAASGEDESGNNNGAAEYAVENVDGGFAEKLMHAYILYYADNGILPNSPIGIGALIDFASGLIDPDGGKYSAFIGGLIAETIAKEGDAELKFLAELKNAADGIKSAVSVMSEPASYTETAAEINSLLSALGGVFENGFVPEGGAEQISALGGDIEPRLAEQIYVLNMIEKGLTPTEKVRVCDLTEFIFAIAGDPVIANFIDGETRAEMDGYKKTLDASDAMFNGEKYSRMVFTLDIPREGDETFAVIALIEAKAEELWEGETYVAGSSVALRDIKNDFEKDTLLISAASIIMVFLVIALIYKSLFVPLILVLLIQASTWIAFSFSSLTGEPVYFMAYTIVSCIQMGAAIDYGILLSSRYLHNRKSTGKKEAASRAVKEAVKTILTSGSIMLISGVTLYLVSSTLVISSIGLFIFRGVGISIAATLVVLPPLLMLFDKAIERTTLKAGFYTR
ncbi:MAG: MMPL family transporter [Clostridiales bacterium]|jgi:predicted RND superfamily exporter protein|nr:MMPL family transporter [Clostridiales bacterium]